MYAAFFILALIASAFAQTPLGGTVDVQANQATTINYIAGPTLVITVDRNANVTLSSYVNVQAGLPSGIQTLSFGTQIGFNLQVSPPEARVIQASLTTPALTTSSAGIITGSVSAGALQFDGTFYNQLEVAFNPLSQTIAVDLPTPGIVIFVGINAGVPIPTFYNYARTLAAGVRNVLNYTGEFILNVTASETTEVTVVFSSSTNFTGSPEDGQVALGAYWTIDLSVNTTVSATLAYYYDQAVITAANVVEDSLRFAVHTANGWQFDAAASVDASAMVVSQPTTHFSQWGVFGRDANSESSIASIIAPTMLVAAAALAF